MRTGCWRRGSGRVCAETRTETEEGGGGGGVAYRSAWGWSGRNVTVRDVAKG